MKPLPFLGGALIGSLLLSLFTSSALATANHVVISEIQADGTDAGDEFVELYNPTENPINLTGWRLTRKSQPGTEANLVASISGTIPARSFFLIARPTYDGPVLPDLQYSATSSSFASNGTVLLYQSSDPATLVDKVGLGTAVDFEGTAITAPSANGSVERKAVTSSTAVTMGNGGADEFQGNGEDTNVNSADFVVRTVSNPQNALSALEPPVVPTQTPTSALTPTLTSTPTLTPTPTPSNQPTATPAPTATPTSIPNPTLTPTVIPTVTPTPIPSPTTIPTPTSIGPTNTTTPTPSHPNFPFPKIPRLVCQTQRKTIVVAGLTFFMPQVRCSLVFL